MKSTISVHDTIAQAAGNIVSDMDGEKIMLSVQKGKYFNLGAMGGRIWDLLQEPLSVTQLVTELTSEYEVDPAECTEQVLSFLELLLEEELICLGNEVKA